MNPDTIKKIKQLKPATGFIVATKGEQIEALKTGTNLRQCGVISITVTTRKTKTGWLVFAV